MNKRKTVVNETDQKNFAKFEFKFSPVEYQYVCIVIEWCRHVSWPLVQSVEEKVLRIEVLCKLAV